MNKPLASQPCKRERTYSAIVCAAVRVMAEKDLDTASIDELMQAAGMARGTFYNHFESREHLLRAVIEELRLCMRERVESRIPDDLPDAAVLACMLYGCLQFSLLHPHMGQALVRIAAGKDWWLTRHEVDEQVFPRADRALQRLLGENVSFEIGQAYIKGVLNMVLRHLLDQQLQIADAETLLMLTLRGVGASTAEARQALAAARCFSEELRSCEMAEIGVSAQ